jgi:transketolase
MDRGLRAVDVGAAHCRPGGGDGPHFGPNPPLFVDNLAFEGGLVRLGVSMPSWELFAKQPIGYRDSVLPLNIRMLAIEAGATLGWYKWVGRTGDVIGLDHFGASAPGEVVREKMGFNVDNVVHRAQQLLH